MPATKEPSERVTISLHRPVHVRLKKAADREGKKIARFADTLIDGALRKTKGGAK